MIAAAAALLTLLTTQAEPFTLELASLFSDGVVLQRNARAPLWGSARPGSEVTVTPSWSDDARARTTADEHGRWRVELATPDAGGPHRIVVSAERELAIEDVLIGEVWLCSGQSNMEWAVGPGPLGGVFDWQKEIASADHPRIRHFDTPNRVAHREQRECGGRWVACSPKTVASFSAVAYFFAREIERELGTPVGLLNATWSGTPIQAWMDAATAAQFAPSAESLALVERMRCEMPELSEAQLAGQDPRLGPGSATVLFNAMVAPLAPYALRGFLWYQGESDRERAALYDVLQIAMMNSWRARFRAPQAPFYFVQLAPYEYENDRGETGALREAQRRVLASPNTGMAVTLDLGDPADIHPRNKQDVGKRLARLALNGAYGRSDVVASGPLIRDAVRDGERVRVRFDFVAEGLISAADHLHGFELVDANGAAVTALAEIEDDSVLLWSPKCPVPRRARYGYGAAMQPVLFNKSWLPAAAFCVEVRDAQ